MLIISFAWTVASFQAGFKTCTRRSWDNAYAMKFHYGMVVQAWDKLPRAGGKQVGLIRLTATPYKEGTSHIPDEDYENEGLAWMEEQGLKIRGMEPREFWEQWKAADELVYVVRFKKLEASGLFYN